MLFPSFLINCLGIDLCCSCLACTVSVTLYNIQKFSKLILSLFIVLFFRDSSWQDYYFCPIYVCISLCVYLCTYIDIYLFIYTRVHIFLAVCIYLTYLQFSNQLITINLGDTLNRNEIYWIDYKHVICFGSLELTTAALLLLHSSYPSSFPLCVRVYEYAREEEGGFSPWNPGDSLNYREEQWEPWHHTP